MKTLVLYLVLSLLIHDNKEYQAGETIELDPAIGDPLVAIGTLGAMEETPEVVLTKDLKGDEAIALVKAAATAEDVKALIEGDTRKGVNEAAEARIAELAQG